MSNITTPVFRASFTRSLFKAEAMDGGKPRFTVTAIWMPSKFTKGEAEKWQALLAALDDACMSAFKKKWADLPGNFLPGIRDGVEKEGLEGYGKGTKFATLSTLEQPKISDLNGNIFSESIGNTGEIYPCCYMRAVVSPYTFDNKSKGVALGLRSIVKMGDGPRIDSSGAAERQLMQEADSDWMEQHEDSNPF